MCEKDEDEIGVDRNKHTATTVRTINGEIVQGYPIWLPDSDEPDAEHKPYIASIGCNFKELLSYEVNPSTIEYIAIPVSPTGKTMGAYCCPTCETAFGGGWVKMLGLPKYCQRCGQHLDWTEANL